MSPGASAEEPPRFSLVRWQGAPGCESQERFAELVIEALGPEADEARSPGAPLRISVRVRKQSKSYTLELSTHEGEGQRQIQAKSCEEALKTAAVILSLAIEPTLLYDNERGHEVITAVASSEERRRQAEDDEVPGLPGGSGALVPARARPSRQPVQIELRIAALGDVGTLPRPALGAGLVASARARHYRMSFRLARWAEQRDYLENAVGKGGHFDYLSSSVELCRGMQEARRWDLGICAIGGLGRLNVEGKRIAIPDTRAHLVPTAGGGVYLDLARRGRWHLRLQAEIVANLIRPRYTLMVDVGARNLVEMQVHHLGMLSGRGMASLGLTFW